MTWDLAKHPFTNLISSFIVIHMKNPVALDFKSKLNQAELAQFATNVLTRMSDNPKFASIQSLLTTDLKNAVDQFQISLQEAADRSRTKIAEKNMQLDKLKEVLDTIAAHVTLLAKDEPSIVFEAGFDTRKRAQRSLKEQQPVTALRASSTKTGQIVLEFGHAPLARMYLAEWSTDGISWQPETFGTASKIVLNNLPSRQEVWVRVSALGSLQRKSPPCDPIRIFVQ